MQLQLSWDCLLDHISQLVWIDASHERLARVLVVRVNDHRHDHWRLLVSLVVRMVFLDWNLLHRLCWVGVNEAGGDFFAWLVDLAVRWAFIWCWSFQSCVWLFELVVFLSCVVEDLVNFLDHEFFCDLLKVLRVKRLRKNVLGTTSAGTVP